MRLYQDTPLCTILSHQYPPEGSRRANQADIRLFHDSLYNAVAKHHEMTDERKYDCGPKSTALENENPTGILLGIV